VASPPKVILFALCEAAVTDRESGRTTIVGIFDTIVGTAFPLSPPTFAIHLRLTGLNGPYALELHILAPDLDRVIALAVIPERVVVSDPLQVVGVTVDVVGVELPEPGRYTVRLVYNGRTSEEISFRVLDRP
jgi:hypothetical protein